MFRDFRPRLTTASPTPASPAEIEALFRGGEFLRAVKECKRTGKETRLFLEAIFQGGTVLTRQNRISEWLSFLWDHALPTPANLLELLRRMLKLGDFAGFLKQVYRFQQHHALQPEVLYAIARLKEKGQLTQAAAWERKLTAQQ